MFVLKYLKTKTVWKVVQKYIKRTQLSILIQVNNSKIQKELFGWVDKLHGLNKKLNGSNKKLKFGDGDGPNLCRVKK